MKYIVFDLETYTFSPFNMAPKPVCLSWAMAEGTEEVTVGLVVGLKDIQTWFETIFELLQDPEYVFANHEIAYDFACLIEHLPDLAPRIWATYQNNQVVCTKVRERLLDYAEGTRLPGKMYSLGAIVKRKYGIELDKSADGWRTRYAELDGLPLDRWPEDAIKYSIEDAQSTFILVSNQDARAMKTGYPLPTQFNDSRAAFALKLLSNWGLCTDPIAVENFWRKICVDMHGLVGDLIEGKILKLDKKTAQTGIEDVPEGSRDMKLLRQMVQEHYIDRENIPHTEPSTRFPEGQIKTDAEILELCNHPLLLKLTEYLSLGKLAATISHYRQPVVHAYYDASGAVTGRTSCSNPNMQNPHRGDGVRECFVARPGHVLIACDYDAQEMRTLAQCCLDICGESKLASKFQENPHYDPHLEFAAQLMGISIEEAKKRKKEDDSDVKAFRQRAKAANFGYPGGMGALKFIVYARGYGVDLTFEESKKLRDAWFEAWPEVRIYFNHISALVGQVGEGVQVYPRSGMKRGGIGYCDAANGYFQGLASHASKEALWEVAKRCYTDPASMLYGSRPVIFIHDEIVIEAPEIVCHEAAQELETVMVQAMQKWTPDIPCAASATAMTRWSKGAKRVIKEGRLVPWMAS